MGTQAQVRFAEKSIGELDHPILIVGQNPGKQRKNEETSIVWEGNKSADLLKWVLAGRDNIYLTNICNYREMTPEHIQEGLYDLGILIEQLQPRQIVCLGGISYNYVSKLFEWTDIDIVKLPHPSFIVRFQKDREQYKRLFTSLLFHV